jgi:hypothetical protein
VGVDLEHRRERHHGLATQLAAMTDTELAALAPDPASWRRGIGGRSTTIEVDGAKVFVKEVNLTAAEQAAPGATHNLFGLPLFYQYGIGSAGFGAWRELAACRRASDWCLAGDNPSFPLLHHWRVLPRDVEPDAETLARIRRAADNWDHSEAVFDRLDAMVRAPAAVVLFLEHAGEPLREWLPRQLATLDAGGEAALLACCEAWRGVATFMNARGLLHFDLHALNVLTDGEQLYVADFGLAICDDFELAPAERAFFEAHRLYDQAFVSWMTVAWLAQSDNPPPLTPAMQAVVDRHRPAATLLGGFLDDLRAGSKLIPFPERKIAAALAAAGVTPP